LKIQSKKVKYSGRLDKPEIYMDYLIWISLAILQY